jgi:diguanylate cyclase (GGDEF)-like protein/PAS domain S-box-containing protein
MMAGMDAAGHGTGEIAVAEALIDKIPEMVIVIADDLTVKFVNDRLLEVMGYERDAVLGSNIFDYAHPDDHEYLATTWAKRVANPGETGMFIQVRGRNADGSWRAVEILGLSLLGDGVVEGMVMTLRDLTLRVERGDLTAVVRSMLDRTTDVVIVLGDDGRISYANRRLSSSYGVDADEVVGERFTSLLPPSEHEEFEAFLADVIARGDRAEARIRVLVEVVGSFDEPRTVEWQATNQIGDPLIAGIIVSGRDVTDLVDLERRLHAQTEELRHNAEHDALTHLLNRRAFVGELSAQLLERQAAADDGDVVVLFCDLDRFKQVNDTHGHPVGDHVLRVSAERLRSCLRDQDVLARWGGDEFTALLHGSPAEEAVTDLVARIRQRLAVPITDGGITTTIGVTVGVSRAPVAAADATDLMRTADEAMYARKAPR